MIVETKLEFKDYIKVTMGLIFLKPRNIILIAIFFLILGSNIITGFEEGADTGSILALILPVIIVVSIFLILLPAVIYFTRKKWFYTSSKLQGVITYEFTPEKMLLKGDSFSSEMDWSTIYKVEERKEMILIYHSKAAANFVCKDAFGDRLDEFKDIVRKHKNIKLKFK
ncbi:MAG: hypothetical protein COB15_04450 [Flavobacteriales bacterium]|nr:MAG: hypothetical protein COB15_04450 [Flavobacteriales bacterium]